MTASPPAHRTPARAWFPWRSATLAWAVTAVALVCGLPAFLRLGPWCDLTLYDTAAMNLLRGGIHYRDVFDTNLPGFVWLLALIRAVFGWSNEAVHVADLVIVTGTTALLCGLAVRAGASRAAWAWAVAGIALFYPFINEFNQAQRDTWMLLPAAAAVYLRVRRLMADSPLSAGRVFRGGVLEGVLWGLAVWIKPHTAVVAAAVWLATAPRSLGCHGRRGLLADLGGNVAGGLAVGLAGIAYLVLSGTWPHFVEVFTFWNHGYAKQMWEELPRRYKKEPHYFPPFTYLPVLAIPLAALYVIDAWPFVTGRDRGERPGLLGRVLPAWLWDSGTTDGVRAARLAFAALYLGWTAQALFFQRDFHYAHVPEVFLLLTFLATQRWPGGFLMFAWFTVGSVAVIAGLAWPETPDPLPQREPKYKEFIPHELSYPFWPPGVEHVWYPVRPDWLRTWPECWRFGISAEQYRRREDALRRFPEFHALNYWEELGEVEDWLRAHDVQDGELLCWHDAPHALYLKLRHHPPLRFQHVCQMMAIGYPQENQIRRELLDVVKRGKVRYIVSDLMRPRDELGAEKVGDITEPGSGMLPPGMESRLRAEFPWNQPAVFRSNGGRGRYVIQELRNPIPWPAELTAAGFPPP